MAQAASSINRPTGSTRLCPSSSCFTVRVRDSEAVSDDHLACNNNVSKSDAAPGRPFDEDSSYSMAIKNSSPHAVTGAFSDSCDDDEDDEDGGDEDCLSDRETTASGDEESKYMTVRRRTRSEGTICSSAPVAAAGETASRHLQQQPVTTTTMSCMSDGAGQKEESRLSSHLSSFSSYPSIKCDIIEYL